ncbi:MAG: hypothetical protein Q4D98_01595 [Planctomycetia bacterium]|nr:hypothetical protein [Planctomycetia bacterium]
MKKKSKLPLPDTLFTTRAGNTPHLLWGLSPAQRKGLPKKSEKLLSALYRAATQGDVSVASLLRNLDLATLLPTLPGSALTLLAVARTLPLLDDETRKSWLAGLQGWVSDTHLFHAATDPLEFLWLAAELPATLAFVAPEADDAAQWKSLAHDAVVEMFRDWTERGFPCASLMDISRLLLAGLVRIRFLFPEFFQGDLAASFNTWVRTQIRWTRPDGSLPFSSKKRQTACWTPELFIAALQLDGDLADKKLGITILPDLSSAKKHAPHELPPCCEHSEETASASLRCGWKNGGVQVCWYETGSSASDSRHDVRLELSNYRTPLLSGIWQTELRFDGIPLSPQSEWVENCWLDSERSCFLELEQDWTEGVRLQRQIFVAKKDEFALLADAVLTPENVSGGLHYVSRIPTFDQTTFRFAPDAMECTVHDAAGPVGMLLPLALPEWRTHLKSGQRFAIKKQALEYAGMSEQGSLYMPLFCDLSPVRFGNALTWRTLTVAQRANAVPPSVAAGFRVMISEEQWLLYRSLAPTANRSVLGYNLLAETLVARFAQDGAVEELVTVAGAE